MADTSSPRKHWASRDDVDDSLDEASPVDQEAPDFIDPRARRSRGGPAAPAKMHSRDSSPVRVRAPEDESSRRRHKHHGADGRRPRGASRESRSKEHTAERASTTYHYEMPATNTRPPRIVTQSNRPGENDSRSPSSSADRVDVAPERIVVTAHQSGRRGSQRADSISSHSPRKVTRYEVSKPPLSRSHSYAVRQPAVPEPPPATSHQR